MNNGKQPVKITRNLASRLRQQANCGTVLPARDAGRRHLHWMVGVMELVSNWEEDAEYQYHPWKARGKIHSTNLSELYTSEDEIEVDVYAEKPVGEKGAIITTAYTGLWVALFDMGGFDVCVYDESSSSSSSGSSDENVLLPLNDFQPAIRRFLDEDFERESGQWFVTDGTTAAAPLPYVRRTSDCIELAVAKDSGWDWEMIRTEKGFTDDEGSVSCVLTGVDLDITDVDQSSSSYEWEFETIEDESKKTFKFDFVTRVWCEGNTIKYEVKKFNLTVYKTSLSTDIYVHDTSNQHGTVRKAGSVYDVENNQWIDIPEEDAWGWL